MQYPQKCKWYLTHKRTKGIPRVFARFICVKCGFVVFYVVKSLENFRSQIICESLTLIVPDQQHKKWIIVFLVSEMNRLDRLER